MIPFVDSHTHQPIVTSDIIQVVNCYAEDDINNPYCSVGIHPWYINKDRIDEQYRLLEEKALLKNVIAIGECGLDKLKGEELAFQQKVFEYQIDLSERIKKPLLIHQVRQLNEILSMHKHLKPIQPWVLHGFKGNIHQTRQALKQNLWLSFSPSILNQDGFEEIIAICDKKPFLIETDNSGISIYEYYLKVADRLNMPIEELKKRVFAHFSLLLNSNT